MSRYLGFLSVGCFVVGWCLNLVVGNAAVAADSVLGPQDAPSYAQTMAAQCEKLLLGQAKGVVANLWQTSSTQEAMLEKLGQIMLKGTYALKSSASAKIFITIDKFAPEFQLAKRLKGPMIVGDELVQKKIVFPLAGKKAVLFLTGFNTPETLGLFNNAEEIIKKISRQILRAKIMGQIPLYLAGVSAGLIGWKWRHVEEVILPILSFAAASWIAHRDAVVGHEFIRQLLDTTRPGLAELAETLDPPGPSPYSILLVIQDDAQLKAADKFLKQAGLEMVLQEPPGMDGTSKKQDQIDDAASAEN